MDRTTSGLRRVPELTIYFWIIKLLTTGMGQTTSDYLVHQIEPVIACRAGRANQETASESGCTPRHGRTRRPCSA